MTRPLIVLAGASGFIGSHLMDALVTLGCEVRQLQRRKSVSTDEFDSTVSWNPREGICDEKLLAGAAAVICLNGANLMGRPWTPHYQKTLVRSRLDAVNTLVNAIGRLPLSQRPRVFLSGSAVGFYGYDCGDKKLTEEAPQGEGMMNL